MAPAQGSKFAVLASPDDDEKKAAAAAAGKAKNQQSKNAAKKAKKKQQQQASAGTSEASKPAEVKTKPAGSNPTTTTTTSSSSPKKQQQAATDAKSQTPSPKKVTKPESSSPPTTTTAAKCPVSSASAAKSSSTVNPVQSTFIWLVSACYFFAFVSFYYQIRGLYGDDGVLPLQHYAASLGPKNQSIGPDELFAATGSWVWYIARYGFTLTSALELITLTGALVSLSQLFCGSFRAAPNYIFLFLCYFSIVKVGQTFLHFQWDVLILEVGALTVLASLRGKFAPDSNLVLWPVRWLLFKFMFSSGVVKLTSRCPLWWGLQALDVHFESQCIPTALAYYAHHLPNNWLRLATALTFVLEILGPFLFFAPFRGARVFSFWTQVGFQVLIILTGNYNFFNLLTIAMCVTLLRHEPAPRCPMSKASQQQPQQKKSCRFKLYTYGIFYGLLAYFVGHYFAVTFDKVTDVVSLLTVGPSSRINFTLEDFNLFLTYSITGSIWIGVITLVHVSVKSLVLAISSGCIFTRTLKLTSTIITVVLCAGILSLSLVPLAELDTSGQYLRRVPAPIKRWYETAHEYGLVSGYGLFRVMTGEGGRPELIVEGSNDPNGEAWKQYHFMYKPGDVATRPGFNVPHQPRLDWQMWFAALGTYQSNPWLLNLCYRILTAQPDVLNLLDTSRLPFPPNSPPKYLRISRYLYRFADTNSNDWWKKATNRHAYLPVVNKDTLAAALKFDEIPVPIWVQNLAHIEAKHHPTVKLVLDQLYQAVVVRSSHLAQPHLVMWAVFVAAFLYQWRRCHGSCARGSCQK